MLPCLVLHKKPRVFVCCDVWTLSVVRDTTCMGLKVVKAIKDSIIGAEELGHIENIKKHILKFLDPTYDYRRTTKAQTSNAFEPTGNLTSGSYDSYHSCNIPLLTSRSWPPPHYTDHHQRQSLLFSFSLEIS